MTHIKKSLKRVIFLVLLTMVIALLSSCATPGVRLDTGPAHEADMAGSYTLILYGGNFLGDLETIALLDKEGDEYTFEPYAPDFKYKAIKGVPAKDAFHYAEMFVTDHPDAYQIKFSRVIDPKGETIGYEVRPLYRSFTYGIDDVLDVDYRLREGGKVIVWITLKPSIRRMLEGDSERDRDR